MLAPAHVERLNAIVRRYSPAVREPGDPMAAITAEYPVETANAERLVKSIGPLEIHRRLVIMRLSPEWVDARLVLIDSHRMALWQDNRVKVVDRDMVQFFPELLSIVS